MGKSENSLDSSHNMYSSANIIDSVEFVGRDRRHTWYNTIKLAWFWSQRLKDWEHFERNGVERRELSLSFCGYRQQEGTLKQCNKYSVSIKLEEFLDELSICWLLKMDGFLEAIFLNVSIRIFYSESQISISLKFIFGGFPVSLCIT